MNRPTPPETGLLLRCLSGQVTIDHPLPTDGRVIIGRSPECDVQVSDTGISRQHAAISVGPDGVFLEDLASANGTFLVADETGDDEEAALTSQVLRRKLEPGERLAVKAGDTIHIGATTCVLERSKSRSPSRRPAPVVRDPAMEGVFALAAQVADAPISVLLLGETGVGKEVIAETIVRQSNRTQQPFMKLNCAAFPENLLESELFGYERGAFTGATRAKPGLLESAHGGTVFLDEVGEIPLSTQVKLLRVLEARQVMRIGALAPKRIDVRFIAATNRDLEAESKTGKFREDLYFRLAGVVIRIPALRARPAEIEPLARMFLSRYCEATGRSEPVWGDAALAGLRAHAWRGNIRELKNVVERAAAVCSTATLEASHLPSELQNTGADRISITEIDPLEVTHPTLSPPPKMATGESAERERIIQALEQCAGNQTRAAKLLGVSRTTLSARLNQFGIPRPRK